MPGLLGTEVAAWIPSLDDSGNGTTTANDLVGSVDGTLTNMDAGTDWVADTDSGGVRALDFDGSNDYVVMASSLISGTDPRPITIAAWVKVSSVAKARHSVYFNYDGDAPRLYVHLDQVSGSTYTMELYSNGYATASSSFTLDTDWHHYAWTWAANHAIEYFRDGVSIGTASRVATAGSVTAGASFGGALNATLRGAGFTLQGRMDDVRVFDSILSSVDIASLASSRPNAGGVTGSPWYYELNQQLACYRQENY